MTKANAYKTKDWIIHVNYGIGQVVGIEEKRLGDKNKPYFRVKGQNGTYWIPVDQAETERVRPVGSKENLQKALHVLSEKPQKIEDGYKKRQAHIKTIRQQVSLDADANLVRDLTFLDSNKELSPTEQDSLEELKKRLALEWSVIMEIKPQNARQQLDILLASNPIKKN